MAKGVLSLLVVGLALLLTYGLWPLVDRGAGPGGPDLPEAPLDPDVAARLRAALDEAAAIDALVVVRDGRLAFAAGAADRPMNLASVRKSVLSMLVGAAVDRGLMDLDTTLAELGIDERRTPLTAAEKQATLRDLIAARSGVYLPSGGETAAARAGRPARGSHPPGSHFHYNNWDFNVLGIAFERRTGMAIGEALAAWIAGPIGMQDFAPGHVYFDRWESASDHATYRIFLSPRDLARLGALVAAGGVWEGQQVVPADWIAASTAPVSTLPVAQGPVDSYGHSWWVDRDTGAALASGWGGQYLLVDQDAGLAIAIANDTGGSLLGHLWFRELGARGRPEDLLRIWNILR